ncbi:MAG: priA [Actinomycetia bacterium]|nr:priA [Actinomycetes bacterium]
MSEPPQQTTLGLGLAEPVAEPAVPVAGEAAEGRRVVRVLPDVVGIDKAFDYLVPDGVQVHLGDVVRIKLGPRRVGGWIIELDVEPTPGLALLPLAKVSGRGPSAELVDLATWAAWRWAGRRAHFLRTASPDAVVRTLPPRAPPLPPAGQLPVDPAVEDALGRRRGVLRLAPGTDRYPLVLAAVRAGPVEGGHTLVLCPSVAEARSLGQRLRRDGVPTAIVAGEAGGIAAAGEWAQARAGATVVGARAAAWAPVTDLGRVVVLDEHDAAYQGEATPTWHARDVVAERARLAGAPCLFVSPTPSLEALQWGDLVEPPRAHERAGWPRVEVVDQRDLDPSLGPLFSPALVRLVRGEPYGRKSAEHSAGSEDGPGGGRGRVICVLNRSGRVRLLACSACSTLARCEVCEAAVSLVDPRDAPGTEGGDAGRERAGSGGGGGGAAPDGAGRAAAHFACGRCGAERPVVCLACGGARFKNLRLGVSKAREELEVLAGEPVVEVTGTSAADDPAVASARLLIGTEAVLHRVGRADGVAFLDFDQELLALRYRAGEQALGLLARAARVVRRGSGGHGRILVQTRTPDHPAVLAAVHADPTRLTDAELPLRRALDLPPASAVAMVSGEASAAFVAALGTPTRVRVQGPVEGAWRLTAPDHRALCDALAAVPRPAGRLRIEVDPLRS